MSAARHCRRLANGLCALGILLAAALEVQAGHRRSGPPAASSVAVGERVATIGSTAVFGTADGSVAIATQPANRLGTVVAGPSGQRVEVEFAGGPAGWVSAATLARPYVPPAEASGGWRALVARNTTPTAAQKASIRSLAGLDWDSLKQAFDYSNGFGASSSLLVVRHGHVAGEWGSATAQPVASVSKALTGVAVARIFELAAAGSLALGFLPDAAAAAFLPPAWSAAQPEKQAIPLASLMTMTSGLQADDRPTVPDYHEVLMTLPVVAEPRTQWSYSSASVDLLSIAVERATGRSLREQFDLQIGARIGMPVLSWGNESSGYTVASSRARVAPRDLARLGYMMLLGGSWSDGSSWQRVLGSDSLARLLRGNPCGTPVSFVPTTGSPFPVSSSSDRAFGHLWWLHRGTLPLGPDVPADAFFAHGLGEKLLVVVPSENLVVVRTGSQPAALTSFRRDLMSRIMAAVVDQRPVAAGPWIEALDLVDQAEGVAVRLCDPLPAGAVIDPGLTPLGGVAIQARLRGGVPGSVRFVVDGGLIDVADSAEPFALPASSGLGILAPGQHELTATAYSGPDATGTPGATFRLKLTLVE